MHDLCPLCGRGEPPRPHASFATAGIDWEDAHEVDAVCAGDGLAACAWERSSFSVAENCRADTVSGWFYSEQSCSERSPTPCNCARCRAYWASATCPDVEQGQLFTTGKL